MDINFEIDDCVISDAVESALEDYDFDRPVESAVESYLDDNADSVIESAIEDKLDNYDIGEHVDTNEMMVAMLEDIKSDAYRRGVSAGSLTAKPVRPNYEELAARIEAIALWCGGSASLVADIESVLPLAADNPSRVINAARSAAGTTLGGGFVAGMLYCIKEMKSRELSE